MIFMSNMKRREFLKASAASGIGVLSFATNGAKALENSSKEKFELEEMTVAELQNRMKAGEMSAEKLVERYIARIREIDPKIRSVVEINPDAERLAEELDKERKAGKIRGALHGIPVLLKDNIDTADRMKTTAGSLALLDAPTPKRDAFLVEQLRRSGAVILGKTNLSNGRTFARRNLRAVVGARRANAQPVYFRPQWCGSFGPAQPWIRRICGGRHRHGNPTVVVCPASVCGIVG
jgi:amidase